MEASVSASTKTEEGITVDTILVPVKSYHFSNT